MALRALAEVNLAAIERNAALLRRRIGHSTLCAVVKADGYGHGAVPAARAALDGGAQVLAVATAEEAGELRRAGIGAPILVLGALSDEELPVAVAAGAAVTAWDLRFIQQLRSVARGRSTPVPVHVKLDTGLGRLGTRSPEQALAVVRAVLESAPQLRLEGVMTHFATADGDRDFLKRQLAAFRPFVSEVRALAPEDIVAHAANSAAALVEPESHLDMVRAGIALYGADPMNHDAADHGLEPALALRSYVAALKPIAAGESAGYGRLFVAGHDSQIATLPIGYGDGLPRALAEKCEVLIRGRRHRVRGMVSMDNITVEVDQGAGRVELGDRATIIGVDGEQRQTAEDLANLIGTISYEVLCWISKRVPRAHHRDGTPT